MDLTKIKADIPREVYEWSEKYATSTNFSFVSVLSYRYGEIVERAFGVRKYAKKGVLITEVRRRATGKSQAVVKNLLTSMYGYIPIFESKNRYSNWYQVFDKDDFDKWYECDSPCNFYCRCLNKEFLTEIDEFKFCGFSGGDVIEYLNEYRKNPKIELFGKFGLPLSKLLINKVEKDKQFRSYLFKNISSVSTFGSSAVVYAYNHNIEVEEAVRRIDAKRHALANIPAMRKRNLDCERIIEYCKSNNIGFRVYNDYLEAVIALGLDLKDTKNIYPNDFKAMHDLRIVEYESLKAEQDREKHKELYESFAKAGEKATLYEYSDNDYSMVAPRDISDLKKEGAILGHCVGRMGYDKKMADGKVVIMFLRHTNDLNKPFVTIEYDLTHLKLLQAYAKGNTKPPSEASAFINEWLGVMKKINKQLRAVS